LAYETAVAGRQAALATKQAGEPLAGANEDGAAQFAEPEMDLAALSDDSRELVKITVFFIGFVGLYLIWSSGLPALRIFEDVPLWYHTVTVEGEDKRLPITLADLGLALFYAIGVGILAKRLPALLEIILLRRVDLSSGSRYTVTTLTNYAIIAIGVVLVLNTIGTQWSQLQWLVAALGVGIGFGLQEIVANFISGLIILFERPIRVGDIVTVGDTYGTVTKIRRRATTIRNWDGKELSVPNKELITGRLLNWSLSDQTTRLIISVGIAYGSNVRQAKELLEEAARENENVLDDPAPSVIFAGFGDNALNILLRCFVDSVDLRYPTISALNDAINDKYNAAGIVIAFPQRDLHLDTTRPLQVELRRGKEAPRQVFVDCGNQKLWQLG
jgi:potassium efflux system protein